jgi:hypothetical protein
LPAVVYFPQWPKGRTKTSLDETDERGAIQWGATARLVKRRRRESFGVQANLKRDDIKCFCYQTQCLTKKTVNILHDVSPRAESVKLQLRTPKDCKYGHD